MWLRQILRQIFAFLMCLDVALIEVFGGWYLGYLINACKFIQEMMNS